MRKIKIKKSLFKISVVCPTFNSEHFVVNTLSSILNQKRLPDEIVIVDDGSSDNTIKILEEFKTKNEKNVLITILKIKHLGPGGARNYGVINAKYPWIAFIDSDDLWLEDKLLTVESFIQKNPQKNFFCHDEILVKKNFTEQEMSHSKGFKDNLPIKKQLYYANFISTSTVVCQKDLLIKGGLFDETLSSAQDYELWLRLCPKMKIFVIREILGKYVERVGNITSGNLKNRLINDLKISIKHRDDVPFHIIILRFIRLLISYCLQLFKGAH